MTRTSAQIAEEATAGKYIGRYGGITPSTRAVAREAARLAVEIARREDAADSVPDFAPEEEADGWRDLFENVRPGHFRLTYVDPDADFEPIPLTDRQARRLLAQLSQEVRRG